MKSKLLLDICVAVCWSNAIIDVCEIGIFYSACIQYIETIRNYCGLESAHNVRKETNRTDPASNCFLCEREKKRSRTNTKMKINNFARENVLRVDVKQQKNTQTHAKMATTTKSYTIYIDWSPHCNLIYIVNTWHCSLFLHSFIPPKKKITPHLNPTKKRHIQISSICFVVRHRQTIAVYVSVFVRCSAIRSHAISNFGRRFFLFHWTRID